MFLTDTEKEAVQKAFVERTDEEFFLEAGRKVGKPWMTDTECIWLGYEYTTRSQYLSERFRK